MRRFGLLILLFSFAGSLSAQEFPKTEIFGGYSFANASYLGYGRANLNGWNASATVHLNNWFGLTSDFSGHYNGKTSTTITFSVSCPLGPCTVTEGITDTGMSHSLLFGPQFTLRRKKITPFVHFLLGAAELDTKTSIDFINLSPGTGTITIASPDNSASTTAVAVALGGGADYKISKRLSWRLQADYLQTAFHLYNQNNVRISTGIVFRITK